MAFHFLPNVITITLACILLFFCMFLFYSGLLGKFIPFYLIFDGYTQILSMVKPFYIFVVDADGAVWAVLFP